MVLATPPAAGHGTGRTGYGKRELVIVIGREINYLPYHFFSGKAALLLNESYIHSV